MASIMAKRKPRGGYNNRNYQRSYSDSKAKSNAPSKEDYGIFNNPELLHLLCRGVMGTIVEVTTVNNQKMYGLVKCASPAGGFGIELSHPILSQDDKFQKKQNNLLLLEAKDIKSMVIRDVNSEDCYKSDMPTDQEIAQKVHIENANKKPHTVLSGKPGVLNLQPFFQNERQDNEKFQSSSQLSSINSGSPVIPEESLEDSTVEKKGDHWFPPQDMFSVNQEKYQVSSSYQEEMEQYTIKIDTTSPDYAKKASRAEKLANTIENSSESRKAADLENGSGENEENLFIAVNNGTQSDKQQTDDSSTAKASLPSLENEEQNESIHTGASNNGSASENEQNKENDNTQSNSSSTVDLNSHQPAHLNPEAPIFLPQLFSGQHPILAPAILRPHLPHHSTASIVYPGGHIPIDPQHPNVPPFGAYVVSAPPYPYSPYESMQYIPVGPHHPIGVYPPGPASFPAYYPAAGVPGVLSPRGVPVTAPTLMPSHHPGVIYPPHVYHQMTHHMFQPHQSQRPTSSSASVVSNSSHSNHHHHSSNNSQPTTNTSTSP